MSFLFIFEQNLKMKRIFITVFVVSTLSLHGCMTHPSLEQSQRPQNWGALISDTHNFYQFIVLVKH